MDSREDDQNSEDAGSEAHSSYDDLDVEYDSDGDGMFDFFTGKSPDAENTAQRTFVPDLNATWNWKPLDKTNNDDYIRVLHIEPGKTTEAELACSFHFTNLAHPCLYQALSYAWGSEDRSELVRIGSDWMCVTPTVKQALLRVRHHWDSGALLVHGKRPKLWVDAICINQHNDIEKSWQVAIMGEIYRKAERLLIWLGNEPPGFRFDGEDNGLTRLQISSVIPRKCWFTRRWVLQEFLMQEQRWVLLDNLLFEFSDLMSNRLHGMLLPREWDAIWRALDGNLNNPLLLNMALCQGTDCSDSRDLVYALRGLSKDGNHHPVDYRKDTRNVYVQFAARYACTEWLPLLLGCAAIAKRSERYSQLPSWVPDWTYKEQISPSIATYLTNTCCKRTGAVIESAPPFVDHSDELGPALVLDVWKLLACKHRSQDLSCGFCAARDDAPWGRAENEDSWLLRAHSMYCVSGNPHVLFGLNVKRSPMSSLDQAGHQLPVMILAYSFTQPVLRGEPAFFPINDEFAELRTHRIDGEIVKCQIKRERIRIV